MSLKVKILFRNNQEKYNKGMKQCSGNEDGQKEIDFKDIGKIITGFGD